MEQLEFGPFSDCISLITFDGDIMIIFEFNQNRFWCRHIEKDDNEWIECQMDFPKNAWANLSVVMTKNNYIHFMNFYPKSSLYHIKIHLFDLVPWKVLIKYINPLVFGFIRKFQKQIGLSIQMPDDVINLVLKFCA